MVSDVINIIEKHRNIIELIRYDTILLNDINNIVKIMVRAIKDGNKVMVFGNGGSASDAQHFAAEFINRFKIDRVPLPSISLNTDTSVITSISNDYDYSEIFSKQIQAIGKSGDIVLGISTSGRSLNVLKAFRYAYDNNMITVGLTGIDGFVVPEIVDYSVNIPSNETSCIQESHILIIHIICELIERELFRKE